MKKLSTALIAAGALALAACGGSDDAATADNAAADANLATDDLSVTDNGLEPLPGETLDNGLGTLDTNSAVDATDANLTSDANLAADPLANGQ